MKHTYPQKLQVITQSLSNSYLVQFLRRHKLALASLIILAFFVFLGYYILNHPEVIQSIFQLGYINALWVLVFYSGVVLTNVGIMYLTIRLCRKKLPLRSGILLTIYSSVINFFGPLQSGPGARAIYLKRKIGLRIRDYSYAMLFYYFSFAALNVSLLFINKLAWLSALGIATAVAMTILGIKQLNFGSLKKYVFYIFLLTAVQIIFMIFIYSVELKALNPAAHYSVLQATAYTASANLALFVSLTPGAIGIREAFLIFSQSLHNVPLSSIVATGIVDRAIYVIFLILLFLVSSGLHLKDMFVGKQPT